MTILHGYATSSATARVRIALELKGVDYEFRVVDLRAGDNRSGSYLSEVNPQGQVPVLDIDGHRLRQSLAICEYLDETRPEPALLPADPVMRARCRHYTELVNSGIQPLQNVAVTAKIVADSGDKGQFAAWPQFWIRRGFTALEALLADTAGRYCLGDAISLADVVLAPQTRAARHFGVDPAEFPTIDRIDAALREIDAFAAGLRTE